MTEKAPDINALVGSRICHDLISPLGAIGNGIELLAMSGAASGPEMSLITDSIGNANAKIRFFRVAFGAARGAEIGHGEIRSILQDFTALGRIAIDWTAETDVARADARLIFLMLLCLETAMPYSGEITVAAQDRKWEIAGRSDRLAVSQPLWEGLSMLGMPDNLSPAEVHFALVPNALAAAGRRLTVEIGEVDIRIKL